MKRRLVIAGLCLILLLVIGGGMFVRGLHLGTTRRIVSTTPIVIETGEIHDLASRISMETGPIRFLKIGIHEYRNVRGVPPYYIEVPDLSLAVFVTQDRSGGRGRTHIVSLKDGRDTIVEGVHPTFGYGVGFSTTPNDEVKSLPGGRIALVTNERDYGAETIIRIDGGTVESYRDWRASEAGPVDGIGPADVAPPK
jgi:hypothetical protein